MKSYSTPQAILKAIDVFKTLPGVGERTAMRYVLSLLDESNNIDIKKFSEDLNELTSLNHCKDCHSFCDSMEDLCSICFDDERGNQKTICVVEQFNDFQAIENSGKYKGRYHILGGVLNPLIGVGPEQLNLEGLKRRASKEELTVILAINPSLEGEATCSFIKEILPSSTKILRIGFGMPMGGSLEFLNPQTISTALENAKFL